MAQSSPCNGICLLDQQQICIGCQRSVDEIRRWGSASDQQQRAILDRVAQRRLLLSNSSTAAGAQAPHATYVGTTGTTS